MPAGSSSRAGSLAFAIGLAGVVLRLWGFGAYGFWIDEAWVAISTRVTGVGQTLLALSATPLGWGLLLRPLHWQVRRRCRCGCSPWCSA